MPSRRRHHRPAGQSLVEFALVLPILILIFGAIVQFGIFFWSQNTLTQVTRDTARWAATQQTRPCSAGGAALVTKADEIAASSGLLGYRSGLWSGTGVAFPATPTPRSGVEIAWPIPSTPAGLASADCPPQTNQVAWFVTIRLHHVVPSLFPGIGAFIPGCGNDGCSISSSVQFRMEPSQ